MRPDSYRTQQDINSFAPCKACKYSFFVNGEEGLFCGFDEQWPMPETALEEDLIYEESDAGQDDRPINQNFREDWIKKRRVYRWDTCNEYVKKIPFVYQFAVKHESGKGVYAIACDEDGKFLTGAICPNSNIAATDLNTCGCQHQFFCDRRYPDGWYGIFYDKPHPLWNGQTLPNAEQMQAWDERSEEDRGYHFYEADFGTEDDWEDEEDV